MSSDTTPSAAPSTPPAPGSTVPVDLPRTAAEIASYEDSLLAMARAVQIVGMYGVSHPSARDAVNDWVSHVTPLLRARERLTLTSDGHVASVNGATVSTANPVILSLLRKLYTTRAGRLELLSGFDAGTASKIAEFLADADATRLSDAEHAFEAWVERNRLRHIRVVQLHLHEVREDERIVSAERLRPAPRAKPAGARSAARLKPAEVAAWTRDFKQEAARAGQPAPLPPGVQHAIAAYLRGAADVQPAALAEHVQRAAGNPAHLAQLILKTALVQQEVMQRAEEPVGGDVVNGLRAVVGILQQTPAAQSEEGCHNLARTLAVLETQLLERLLACAGGTDNDARIIRAGVQALQHELEGAALKHDYAVKRRALLVVEEKIRRFFGLASVTAPEMPADQELAPDAARSIARARPATRS